MKSETKKENTRKLLQQVFDLGFSKDIEGLLSFQVNWGNPHFSLQLREEFSQDKVAYRLHFSLGADNSYHFNHFDAVLHKEIVISEAIIEGINVKELEKSMEQVDWSRDYELEMEQILHWENSEQERFYKNIEEIFDSLEGLSLTKEGRQIANALKVKFFADTPAGNFYTFDDLKSAFEVERRFYLDEGKGVTALEAYNILCSRPVLKTYEDINGKSRANWFVIRPEMENYITPVEYLFRNQLRYPPFDLNKAIANLPIVFRLGPRYRDLLRKLEQGCYVEVPMRRCGVIETMYMVANPAKKKVDIFDQTGEQVSRQALLRAIPGAKPRQKNKGKSI